jgi:hypothetical protein
MTCRRWFLKTASILSLVLAIYHFVGIFYPLNSSPPWRHALFVGICLCCSYGFLKPSRYFTYFFLALLVQQFYSHGRNILSQWHDDKVDWTSFLLLFLLPVIALNLILDVKSKIQ